MKITFEEYQKFAGKGVLPQTALHSTPEVGFALGLTGEAGEVADDIKKRIFHGRNIPMEHTLEELGDVMWYVANLCNTYDVNLEDVVLNNIKKLKARYPDEYKD